MHNLFVYGTLQFPGIIKKLTGKSFSASPAILENFKRYCVKYADYPAIVASPGSKTHGHLLEDVDDFSFTKIVLFEGEEYDRIVVPVWVNQRKFAAYVFVWNAETGLLEEKDWDMPQFEENSLDRYIDEIIPEMLFEPE